MKAIVRHPLRLAGRGGWFAGEVLLSFGGFLASRARQGNGPRVLTRALALQRHSRRCLRSLGAHVDVNGPVPSRGLLVTNHLSYLDILVISSITPAVFVSKSDVRAWPVFGWFAHQAGTIFVERTRRSDVSRVNDEVTAALDAGALLVIFPEGTSSDGCEVLPFKSSLLEPVVGTAHPLTAGCLRYTVANGDPGRDICYWGDMTFGPHLLNLLTKRGVAASVKFSPVETDTSCRKELARQLHDEVRRLHQSTGAPLALKAPDPVVPA